MKATPPLVNADAGATSSPEPKPTPMKYPTAVRDGVVEDYHGVSVSDPYRWLEDVHSPETRNWIQAENLITRAYVDAVPGRAHIESRLTALWNYERYGVPEQRGVKYFFTKNEGLQNQPVLYVEDGPGAPPRALVDPNQFAADGTIALAFVSPSPDGRLVAYGLSTAGSDWTEVRVRDVATSTDLPEHLKWIKFCSAAWRKDGTGFFYSRFPEPSPNDAPTATNFHNKLFYHRVGTPQSEDRLVYERPDEKQWMFDASVSDDDRHLVVLVSKSTDEERRVLHADLGKGIPRPGALKELVSTFDAAYDFVGSRGARLWFRTTLDAPRGRIVSIDARRTSEDDVLEVVPESPDTLEDVAWVGDRLIASYLKDAKSEVRVYDPDGTFRATIALPGIGTVHGFSGRQADRETFFSFGGFTTPTTIFRYDPQTNASQAFLSPRLTFDPGRYETEQSFVTSTDGTRIPVFVNRRLEAVPDGKTPTYLYGYGGFGVSLTPSFDPAGLEWMEMGGLWIVANLRGGGEYGKAWHDAGKKEHKQRVFDDFIAVARWLVASKATRPDRLAIGGRSNGGLLVGACITQHPELFGAALPAVGVLDMLRYQRFTIGWAWADEYGTSDDAGEFQTLLSYSPLHNVKPGTRYPATLVTASDHDDRVVPSHSFRFAAALQAAQAGSAPVLIRVETDTGHGAATPTSKLIAEQADRWTFLVRALDFIPTTAPAEPHVTSH